MYILPSKSEQLQTFSVPRMRLMEWFLSCLPISLSVLCSHHVKVELTKLQCGTNVLFQIFALPLISYACARYCLCSRYIKSKHGLLGSAILSCIALLVSLFLYLCSAFVSTWYNFNLIQVMVISSYHHRDATKVAAILCNVIGMWINLQQYLLWFLSS